MTDDQRNEAFGNWLIQEAEQGEAQIRERRLIAGTALLSFVSECEREADERGLPRDYSPVGEKLLSAELADLAEVSVLYWQGA